MKDPIRKISPLAGKPAQPSMLVDVPKLVTAYYTEIPDPSIPKERVLFGTSGHRGSSFTKTFNERHILAITQAICLYRALNNINGPLFIGFDTHALSIPAFASALEVLAANGIEIMISERDEYTLPPAVSLAIIKYNKNRTTGLADGIIITPSHNPPHDGGFKYNPPNGGPSSLKVTTWIQNKANEILTNKLKEVKRTSFENALHAPTTHRYDYLNNYINDLGNVIDMDVIRDTRIHMGVDPLGGAGVHYWGPIAEHYKLNLTVTNHLVDPTFRFMTVDWDGQIRMNPASPYAMVTLLALKDQFSIAFACDTDHDRHGIITPKAGLIPPNHYLSVAIFYLIQERTQWPKGKAIGKTLVSSQMINRVAEKLGHKIYEVPVGFKWFVDGLIDGSLEFCCEESAGAVFCRRNGDVWTTDKDGIISALLSAEITARTGKDISDIYHGLEQELGKTFYKHDNYKATLQQKEILAKLSPGQIHQKQLAGEPIIDCINKAPGNHADINGLKVISKGGWFVVRPSGTEAQYEIYAESFKSQEHLEAILEEAQTFVNNAFNTNQVVKQNK